MSKAFVDLISCAIATLAMKDFTPGRKSHAIPGGQNGSSRAVSEVAESTTPSRLMMIGVAEAGFGWRKEELKIGRHIKHLKMILLFTELTPAGEIVLKI